MQQSKTESSYHPLCFGPSVVDPAKGKGCLRKGQRGANLWQKFNSACNWRNYCAISI